MQVRGDGGWPEEWQWECRKGLNSVHIRKVQPGRICWRIYRGFREKEGNIKVDNNNWGQSQLSLTEMEKTIGKVGLGKEGYDLDSSWNMLTVAIKHVSGNVK